MTWETRLLRLLLVLILAVLALAGGLLYLLSRESAQNWPELAHLQVPLYVAVLVGFIPVVVAIALVFDFLKVIDQGEAFSVRAVQILHRLRLLIGVFAGYLVLFLAGAWVAMQLMHPTLLFGWFAVEVAALFLFTLVALLERIFSVAPELRSDRELTV
jgi:hypothetical protein